MKFNDKHFKKFSFANDQIKKNFENALKDFKIAKKVDILEVKFNYTYRALIKIGITLLSKHQVKVKSMPGHHIKILEKMSEILNDPAIIDIGDLMRSKRNLDLYSGGVDITEKECREFIRFVEGVLNSAKKEF